MPLTINVKSDEVINSLNEFNRYYDTYVKKDIDQISDKIIKEAKTSHRFKSRTGNLVEATKKELGIDRDSLKAIYKIDDVKAPYGKYIHEGFKSWAADKYLENAVERNKKEIIDAAEKGINEAISKAGL